jgi:RNA polymerase sigma-70 factor (ECF subfamily)
MATNAGDDDDLKAVNQTLAGDQRAFEGLVRKHQGLVYNVLYRMVLDSELARDLTQDAFLKAFRNLRQFDQRQFKAFKPWLVRIASNGALDYLRQKWPDSLDQILVDEPLQEPASAIDVSDEVDKTMFVDEVAAALLHLPVRYRQAFVLRYQFEFSYEEISRVMQENENTVRTLLFRAKDRLRKLIIKEAGRIDNVT